MNSMEIIHGGTRSADAIVCNLHSHMKTTPRFLCLLSTLCLALGTGHARADATITSLPYTISSPGVYTVGSNLSVTGANGITITSDDVVVDLAGHTITGASNTQYAGVLCFTSASSNQPRRNLVVKNGTIRGFKLGVYLTGTANDKDTGAILPAVGFRVSDVTVIGSGASVERCIITELGVATATGLAAPCGIFVQGGFVVKDNYVSNLRGNNNNGSNTGIYAANGGISVTAFVLSNNVEGVDDGVIFEYGVYRNNIVTAISFPYTCTPGTTTNGGGNL